MQVVLYRKYRPKTFKEVVGQDHIVRVLQNALRLGRVAHAYLFSGPRGTGKTTMARLLAKYVNCLEGSSDAACGTCNTCEQFLSGRALDLVEIDAASSRGIDEIRALREAVNIVPSQAKYKVYIIDEVHQLTKEAFNALLKTLEEPPSHVIFILATTEPEKVLDTVISRTQHFEFRRVSEEIIFNRLARLTESEGFSFEESALRLLAFFADGSLRDAESMLGQVLSLSEKPVPLETARAHSESMSLMGSVTEEGVRMLLGAPPEEAVIAIVEAVMEENAKRAVDAVAQSISAGFDCALLMRLVIRFLRAAMLLKVGVGKELVSFDAFSKQGQQLLQRASELDEKTVERYLRTFLEAYNRKEAWGVLPQLPLELAILRSIYSEVASSATRPEGG